MGGKVICELLFSVIVNVLTTFMQATSFIILEGFLQLVVDALWCIVMLEIKGRILLVVAEALVGDCQVGC